MRALGRSVCLLPFLGLGTCSSLPRGFLDRALCRIGRLLPCHRSKEVASVGGYKFAVLVLPTRSEPEKPRLIHDGKETFVGSISSLVPAAELGHWQEWLGSLAWREIDARKRLVISRAAAKAPGVLDDENEHLQRQASNAWRAFLLCKPHINTEGQSWLLSGDGGGAAPGSALVNVRTVSRIDPVVRPMYATNEKFWTIHMQEFREQREKRGTRDESWFGRWVEIDKFLCNGPPPEILSYALLAHSRALAGYQLEFVVPDLVRAAEGVLAMDRKNVGAQVFRDRALRLVPTLRTDRFVGSEVETLLVELYQARNDCVHGKVPFLELRARGNAGEERAAQLAYVADVLAREALLVAIHHDDQSVFATRETLEQAWLAGAFPPKATPASR